MRLRPGGVQEISLGRRRGCLSVVSPKHPSAIRCLKGDTLVGGEDLCIDGVLGDGLCILEVIQSSNDVVNADMSVVKTTAQTMVSNAQMFF